MENSTVYNFYSYQIFVLTKSTTSKPRCFQLIIDVLDFYLKCRSSDALDHLQEGLDKIKQTKLEKYYQQEKKIYQDSRSKQLFCFFNCFAMHIAYSSICTS